MTDWEADAYKDARIEVTSTCNRTTVDYGHNTFETTKANGPTKSGGPEGLS
jgi:hypothetical protein